MAAEYKYRAAEVFLKSDCLLIKGMSWRDWIYDVLQVFVSEGEGFSGKRPNCDSGWERVLADGLHTAGLHCKSEDGDVDYTKVNTHFRFVSDIIFYSTPEVRAAVQKNSKERWGKK